VKEGINPVQAIDDANNARDAQSLGVKDYCASKYPLAALSRQYDGPKPFFTLSVRGVIDYISVYAPDPDHDPELFPAK